ncbi:hypothetical protein PIB30_032812 [Stylosanthes scabra]|uniref:Uncharacterized protein n=1 Tax=Stylosanthes scabra TaxID=79078 RepID=A0ABU6XAH0_9FABA|nr:hypothetical protein [Stylosanthes scabra]
MRNSGVVERMSECFIKPHLPTKESTQFFHLTPWDIVPLSIHYIQKGLLFMKPQNQPQDFTHNLLHNLKHSLSLTLVHFYPLAGRLVTHQTQNPPSYSVSVDCINSPGARFIHATLDLTVSDILSPVHVPPIVHSFFDLNKAVNHDGHTMPLFSVHITELIDGVFIGCSMNHCVADGTSYWSFFNTWSEIFQSQAKGEDFKISHQPIHKRWFRESCGPLINLPFKHHDEFICRYEAPKLRERIFHFTADSIAKLKAKANKDSNTSEISSFQSLSAHVWRSITRARSVPSDERSSCIVVTNNRTRMEPPLPQDYFGNSVNSVKAVATAGELGEHDLGWAAWKVHEAVAKYNHRVVMNWLKEWLRSPAIHQTGGFVDPYSVVMSSSPRFNVYGNEFGMGKAVAVLSGYANKYDGKVTSYPGREGGGSIQLEVCLSPHTMSALESDQHFMDTVTVSSSLETFTISL